MNGQGTPKLGVIGYSVLVDASAFPGTALLLMPVGLVIDTTGPAPQSVSLLPQAGLTLELRTTPPKSAAFDMERNGRITLSEPYPFVEIRQQGTRQLIRLTKETLRQKRPCRPVIEA